MCESVLVGTPRPQSRLYHGSRYDLVAFLPLVFYIASAARERAENEESETRSQG